MSKQTSRRGSISIRNLKQPKAAKARKHNPLQFNWQKHWKKKVKPHLDHPLVQIALDIGMRRVAPDWTHGDPPYIYGVDGPSWAEEGTLAWYQPYLQCHAISLFSMVIGVINYPELEWKFILGRLHTVPVGFQNGQPRVVMDILWSHNTTSKASMDYALREKEPIERHLIFSFFEEDIPDAIREIFFYDTSNEHRDRVILGLVSKLKTLGRLQLAANTSNGNATEGYAEATSDSAATNGSGG